MSRRFRTIKACRACTSGELETVVAFGETPLADALRREQSTAGEKRFPLTLALCTSCSLVQILEDVDPTVLFDSDYPYFSSFSDAWVAHSHRNADELIERCGLDDSKLVVEIACNDGYLLRRFQERGVGVLGIDPAPGPAAAARALGIEVAEEFFTREVAERMSQEGIQADVVIANNVLAHVPDLPGFVAAIGHILTPDGVAVVECPYVGDMIKDCEFDTIYHEHHCYFSVTALDRLFRSQSLSLNEVRRLPTHGGSLRLYVERAASDRPSVDAMLGDERAQGLDDPKFYRAFAHRVDEIQESLRSLLADLHHQGKRVAAYAAAAKGATLLNTSGVEDQWIEFVVDRNEHKHGRYMPGRQFPIRPVSALLEEQPDFVLLLAWNHQAEILAQQQEYQRRGGRFIVPIPNPRVLDRVVG